MIKSWLGALIWRETIVADFCHENGRAKGVVVGARVGSYARPLIMVVDEARIGDDGNVEMEKKDTSAS